MSSLTICPACGARFRGVPQKAVGKTFACRRCKKDFIVRLEARADPEPPATVADIQPEDPAPPAEAPPTIVEPGQVGEISQASEISAAGAPPVTEIDPGGEGPPPTLIDSPVEEVLATKIDGADDAPPPSLVPPPVTAVDHVEEKPVTKPKPAAPDLWSPGDVILGLYEVINVLGKGGMGAVYRVRHLGWNVDLAVKTPLAKILDIPGGAKAFVREAETWVNLGLHPHVVSAFYVRKVDGVPRVFAEFVDGQSLQQVIHGGQLTDLATLLDIAIQTAWGLHYSHECGVIHQDVKPGNVLIDGEGVAKITDFGLARAGAAGTRRRTAVVTDVTESVLVTAGGMTPAYCSPEQQKAEALSRRSDLWSWAVTLLEVIIGKVTWKSGAVAPSVLEHYLETVDADKRRIDLPEPLVELLRRCFEKDPDQRPASMMVVADELSDLFQEVTGGEYRRQYPIAGRDTADSLNNRAVSLLDLGREQEAINLWEQALAGKALHVEATYNSVVHAWKRGEMSDQEVLLRMQELRRTETATGRDEHLLGKIYLALAEYDDALALFKDAANSDGVESDDVELVRDLSLAQCGLATQTGSKEHWLVARSSLEAASDLSRTDPYIMTAYAAAVAQVGEREEAERIYGEASSQLHDLPPDLDQAVQTFVPRSEVLREWRPFSDGIVAVALTPPGDRLAAVGDGHRITLWNPRDDEAIATLYDAERRATALAVLNDGRTIATACEQEPIQLWDLKRGLRLHALQPHQGSVGCLAMAVDGASVIGGSTDRKVRVWDLEDRSIRCQLEGHDGAVTAVAEGAGVVVSGSLDGTVRVWDLASGACRFTLTGHGAALRSVAVHEGRRLALSGGDDGVVRLWSLDRGEVIRAFKGHSQAVTAVAFAAKGKRALSASKDGSVRLWALATALPSIVSRFETGVTALHVGGDGRLAAAVVGDSTLALIRPFMRRPYQLPYAVCVPVSAVEAVQRAGSYDLAIERARLMLNERRFDEVVAALEEARSVPGFERSSEALSLSRQVTKRFPHTGLAAGWEEHSETVCDGSLAAVALESGGGRLAVGLGNGRVMVKAAHEEEWVGLGAHDQQVSSVAWVPGRDAVLSSSWDGTLVLWNTDSNTVDVTLSGHTGYVHRVLPLADGERCLSVGEDGDIRLWHLGSPDVCEVLHTGDTPVHAATVSRDGCLALAASHDHALVLWDLEFLCVVAVLEGHTTIVNAVEMAPDGLTAVSAGSDSTLFLWDLKTGRCLRRYDGLGSEVLDLAFSPDGGFMATGNRAGEVQLWNLRHPKAVRTFEGHSGPLTAVAFSADGSFLHSAGSDGTLRRWLLDWQPELRAEGDWSERARPAVELLLAQKAAEAEKNGGGSIRVTTDDRRTLHTELARSGLGWLRNEGVEAKLVELAGSWAGATSATTTIREAERARLPRAWRAHRERRRWGPVGLAVVLLVIVASASAVLVVVTGATGFDETRIIEAQAAILRARSQEYSGDVRKGCQVEDRDLYLEWCLDPREADSLAISCLCALADDRAVTSIVDRLRVIHRKAAEVPNGLLELPPRQFVTVDAEEKSWTHRSELIRLRRLTFTLFALAGAEAVEPVAYLIGDRDAEVREAVARGLGARGDRSSVASVVEMAEATDPGTRLAVAKALTEIIASERLSARRALGLVEELCSDSDPEVRRAAVTALRLFDSKRALRLATTLASDPDPTTAAAAEAVVGELRRR